ncbi:His-Xaa-Ser system radical SAM maturase HxsC [Alteromonas sp. a30]|uniref:His-Xaa-Ser system radical SAM maturase HxsC n=1 Tax=Alteromonas sp. a30 TaxID=2730917 RepID=UPI002281928E|nr:His-Xaa-Ser system radical SAM maturase HxsC [Alteromonas sp. a30]MCY7297064.1 His-Xaa-Ser system radical SAM maturase HxsC [Alteromonas sp. a30]
MTKALRPDVFYLEELKNIFGPVQILKQPAPELSNLPIPKLIIDRNSKTDESSTVAWCPLIDKWAEHGDIAFADGRGKIRIVLSKKANANTLLVTEQCDNLCHFCSQPPRKIDDKILFAFAAQSIVSFNSHHVIGISGGEPLLDQSSIFNFFKILDEFKNKTPLHILSNGRAFKDKAFTKRFIESAKLRDVEIGIPLYSTSSRIHDYLVNKEGAWNDTVKGLINAGNMGLPIEIRVIPTKQNYCEISAIVEMALTCLNSITRISIMNLEQTGWAKKNWNNLYVKPDKYLDELENACQLGNRFGTEISLFNYPLCHLNSSLYKYSKKSISDWKNTFPSNCNYCVEKEQCGGFFTSTKNIEVKPLGQIL